MYFRFQNFPFYFVLPQFLYHKRLQEVAADLVVWEIKNMGFFHFKIVIIIRGSLKIGN